MKHFEYCLGIMDAFLLGPHSLLQLCCKFNIYNILHNFPCRLNANVTVTGGRN